MRRNSSGFTLIEVLLATALLGLLAVTVLASLSGSRDKLLTARLRGRAAVLARSKMAEIELDLLAAAAETTGEDEEPIERFLFPENTWDRFTDMETGEPVEDGHPDAGYRWTASYEILDSPILDEDIPVGGTGGTIQEVRVTILYRFQEEEPPPPESEEPGTGERFELVTRFWIPEPEEEEE